MPPKKEAPKKDMMVEIISFLIGLALLGLLLDRIESYLSNAGYGSLSSIWAAIERWVALHVWPVVKAVGALALGGSIIGLVYNNRELAKVAKEERAIYGPFPEELEAEKKGELAPKNDRWERVITHINSANSADWRLAIIEADIMLDELLRTLGYHGDTIGDMLKGVEKSDMLTLDAAWEAHKVRNQIAHAGADYALAERDAKRIIALYESVFKEFKII